MNENLYTGRLVRLRAYENEDAQQAQAYINDPRVQSLMNGGILFPYTYADEVKFVQGQTGVSSREYQFAIDALEDPPRYIGGCGFNHIDWKNRWCEVGIMIGHTDYWGRGYGTDAMAILLRFAFEELNLNRVMLKAFAFNPRAIASYEKNGFVKEGVLRGQIFRQGEYHDEIVMGLMREEWLARQSR